jgi:hypothetical protein
VFRFAVDIVVSYHFVAAMVDFNGKEAFGGRSFLSLFGKQIDESGIMALWGAYAKDQGGNTVKTEVDPSLVRSVGKPLLKLELNRYGEPQVPNPAKIPEGEQANIYLPQVIRNIVIYNYGTFGSAL